MENKNVKELREIAKERKIKYYYKLRREDLLAALVHKGPATVANPDTRVRIVQRPIPAPCPVVQRPVAGFARSILDEPIPSSASSPVLAPESKRPVPAPRPTGRDRLTSTLTTAARSVASYVANRYNDIIHWIEPYVPEVVKKKVSDTGIEINKKNRVSQIARIQNSVQKSNCSEQTKD